MQTSNISSSSGVMLNFPNLDETDEKNLLVHGYDTDDNWTWPKRGTRTWEIDPAAEGYQQFYDIWRKSTDSVFHNKFPYKLSLGKDPSGALLLPFRADDELGEKILVTRSYEQMYHRLMRLRMSGRAKGAVLTGQPGIGKTTFLKFMLARLISTRQVVVLCDNRRSYLFYAGTVYSRSAEFGFMNLPERQATRYFPVWALIDVDFENRGPNLASTNVWPIQASCPNPVLWHAWRKQHRAALLGMPLWSMEELMAGFDLHTFRRFLRGLKKSLPLLDRPTLPTALDRDTDAILKVLQAEREKVEEDCDKMGGVMTSVPDQDATMVDETNKPQTPADQVRNALKILVRNATEEFGFAPRDVYNGVLLLFETRDDHRRVMTNLTCSDLVSLVRSFSGDCQLDTRSENVVAVHPHQITDRLDGWEVRFKSTQITRGVERMVQEVEVKNLRETYCLLHKIPEASVLAGWFFETLTRRMFSEGWEGPAPPQLTYMVSNNCDPPTFFTNPSCPSLPYKPRIRTVTEVKFAPNHGIPDVTLDEGKFYISTATDNPLFDSFTVRRYPGIIIISVFRISIAKSHGRSAEGYSRIHKIIRRVRELLEEATLQPEVRVVYSLVCPEDNLQHEWKMPPGWTENAEEWDHPGVVSCIRVPVSGHLNA